MAQPITGDATKGASVKTIALTLPQPVVAKADLLKLDNPINDKAMSGKQLGSTVLAEDGGKLFLVAADGDKPSSLWINVGTGVTLGTIA